MKQTALSLALLVSGVAIAAKPLSVGSLPESDFADTEVSTNVSLAATPTNNVEIVFGRDADGDGELSRLERDFVLIVMMYVIEGDM